MFWKIIIKSDYSDKKLELLKTGVPSFVDKDKIISKIKINEIKPFEQIPTEESEIDKSLKRNDIQIWEQLDIIEKISEEIKKDIFEIENAEIKNSKPTTKEIKWEFKKLFIFTSTNEKEGEKPKGYQDINHVIQQNKEIFERVKNRICSS